MAMTVRAVNTRSAGEEISEKSALTALRHKIESSRRIIFDDRMRKNTYTFEDNLFSPPRTITVRTGLEHYSVDAKISAIWNHGGKIMKNRLLFFLEKKSSFTLRDWEILGNISDAEFFSKYIQRYEPSAEAESRRGRNKAVNIFASLVSQKVQSCKRLHDVGCGSGEITLELGKLLGTEVAGVEIELNYVTGEAVAKKNWIYYFSGDPTFPWPDGHFDLIVLILSAHHFENLRGMFSEITRVLAIGGKLLLREHNVRHFFDVMFVELEHSIADFQRTGKTPSFFAHYRSAYAWDEILKDFGLQYCSYHYHFVDRRDQIDYNTLTTEIYDVVYSKQ